MMDSLRGATQNTMFEQWLDATMRPPVQPTSNPLQSPQVCKSSFSLSGPSATATRLSALATSATWMPWLHPHIFLGTTAVDLSVQGLIHKLQHHHWFYQPLCTRATCPLANGVGSQSFYGDCSAAWRAS